MPVAQPTLNVQVGLTANPLDPLSGISWTDITAYVMELECTRGKQHELSRVEAGTARLKLNNRDRRFDPTNTSSPYYPNLKVMNRLRIYATYNFVTYPLWCGFVDGWGPIEWPDPSNVNLQLAATDSFKLFSNTKMKQSVWELRLRALGATSWFRLGDKGDTTTCMDTIGGFNGVYSGGVSLGGGELIFSSNDTGVQFDGVSGRVLTPRALNSSGFTVGFWMNAEQVEGGTLVTPLLAMSNQFSIGYWKNDAAVASRRGKLTVNWYNGAFVGWTADAYPGRIDDGQTHFITVSWDGTYFREYVDGVNYATVVGGGPTLMPAGVQLGFGGGDPEYDGLHKGGMDELVIFDYALSDANVADLYDAGHAPWDFDRSGTRIARILDLLGVPSADRSIDTGNSFLGPAVLVGNNAVDILQQVEAAESGLFFVNGAGRIIFYERDEFQFALATNQATFGDHVFSGEFPYVLPLEYALDDLDLWNEFTGARANGTELSVEDTSSQTTYGVRSSPLDVTLCRNDFDVKNRLQYGLIRYSTPLPRVRSVTIDPRDDPTNLWPQSLGRELGQTITVKARPVGGGAAFSQQSTIEMITHKVMPGLDWHTTWSISTTDPNIGTYWIWGTGQWGSTTKWYV